MLEFDVIGELHVLDFHVNLNECIMELTRALQFASFKMSKVISLWRTLIRSKVLNNWGNFYLETGTLHV
jgi:hypothetical protein